MERHHYSVENEILREDSKSPETVFIEASKQLELCKSLIIESWEKRVREQVKAAEGKTSLAIVNTLSYFLDELVAFIKLSGTSDHPVSPEKGMSRTHGEERARLAGYFLPQLLKEFSILREIIVEVLLTRNVSNHEVRSLVDKAIDSVISLAATEFAKVQQEQTEAALRKAEISNQDLEHFAAVAAHDLKSPLATITGYLELISGGTEEICKEASKYIEVTKQAAERMRNLIDHLLEYAKLIEVDRPFQTVDIENIVNIVIQNLSDSIEKTDTLVTMSSLPKVNGDSILLTQLFQNLIANSIKFHSKNRPEIFIKAEEQGDMWLFSLTDNGIGFDPKDEKDIFTMYKKLHGGYQGAGIGLATCRKVVELHGGTIWANSSPGHGSVFYFTLPKH